MTATNTITRPKIAPKMKLKEPSRYNVIYVNDDVTSMDFVIESLCNVFDYDVPAAHELTMQVHEEGSAIVATLPFEIAEQKHSEVVKMARRSGWPLQVKLESE